MKNPLKSSNKKQDNPPSARVVDGKLILSFPDALNPVLWQMDLSEAKSSALEVVEDKKDKSFKLILKTHQGETIDVAQFTTRAEAVEGLTLSAEALANAHGQIRPGPANDSYAAGHEYSEKPRKRTWLKVVLGIIAVLVVLNIWSGIRGTSPDGSFEQAGLTATSGADVDQPGVPVSADAFLKGR